MPRLVSGHTHQRSLFAAALTLIVFGLLLQRTAIATSEDFPGIPPFNGTTCSLQGFSNGTCAPATSINITFANCVLSRDIDLSSQHLRDVVAAARHVVLFFGSDASTYGSGTCGTDFFSEDPVQGGPIWNNVISLQVHAWTPSSFAPRGFRRVVNRFPSITNLTLRDTGAATLGTALAGFRAQVKHLKVLSHRLLATITEVPQSLITLEVQFTPCRSLSVAAAANLTRIDVSNNRLVSLPADITELKNLRTVYADNNIIETVSARFVFGEATTTTPSSSTLPSSFPTTPIRRLSLINNRVSSLSAQDLKYYPELEDLDLTSNSISVIMQDAFSLTPNITRLNMTRNNLQTVEPAIFEPLNNLKRLYLDFNNLQSLKVTKPLSTLVYLEISHNLLNQVEFGPDYLNDNQLVTLRARNNTWTNFSTVAHNFPRLTNLDLNFNFIQTLEKDAFSRMPMLRDLQLRGNRIRSLRGDVFRNNDLLTSLDLGANAITSLDPGTFRGLSSLTRLDVHQNRIEALPQDFFSAFPKLSELALDNNRLAHISADAFVNNLELTTVVLSGNSFRTIPETLFSRQAKLRSIFIADCPYLTGLPPSLLAENHQLTLFDCGESPVQTLADDFFSATPNLQTLRLFRCGLIHFPRISHLKNLVHIVLSSNYLEEFDLSDLAQMDGLVYFSFGDESRPMVLDSSNSFQFPPTLRGLFLRDVKFGMTQERVLSLFERLKGSLTSLTLSFSFMDKQEAVHMDSAFPQVCKALNSSTMWLRVGFVDAERLTLCTGKNLAQLSVRSNARLQVISHDSHIESVTIRDSNNLRTLAIPTIASLDMSRTSIPFSNALCTLHGFTSLIANAVTSNSFKDEANIFQLLNVCNRRGGYLDLSNNEFLKDYLSIITSSVSESFVLHPGLFQRTTLPRRVPSRTTFPLLTLSDGPIRCITRFASELYRDSDSDQVDVYPQITQECSCAEGFQESGNQCLPPPVSRVVIAGTAVGSTLGTLVVVAVAYYVILRFQHHKKEKHTLFKALLSKEDEVEKLKQAWNISQAEVKKVRKIAEGAQGEVWLGRFYQQDVAVKIFKQNNVEGLDDQTIAEFQRELEFLREAKHGNLVQFFGGGTEMNGLPFIVLQYVPLGSLRDILDLDLNSLLSDSPFQMLETSVEQAQDSETRAHKSAITSTFVVVDYVSSRPTSLYGDSDIRLDIHEAHESLSSLVDSRLSGKHSRGSSVGETSVDCARGIIDGKRHKLIAPSTRGQFQTAWDLKVSFARDIAAGMLYIHDKNRVHRDLKPQNVLVSEGLVAKITDFGCIGERILEGVGGSDSGKYQYNVSDLDIVGTPLYIAPEVEPGVRADLFRADVFSFGVLLWEIATQKLPDLVEQEEGDSRGGPYMMRRAALLKAGKSLRFGDDDYDHGRATWYRDLANACMDLSPQRRPLFARLFYTLQEYADVGASSEI